MRYTFGDCILEIERRALRRAGMPVKLQGKVYQVLVHLIAHRDRLETKGKLLEHVWPGIYVED